MPIGIVTDDQFFQELSDKKSVPSTDARPVEATIVDKPSRGRSDGDVNTPDSLRQIIAEEQLMNGRQSALGLAREFGISSSSVSAYANGATSTKSYHSPTQSIIGHINKTRERAVKRASRTLNQALSSITQEKLDYAEAKDLSGIAKDMSVIIKNLEPEKQPVASEAKQPQFIIYAPQFKKEESFEVITVNE